jgi:Zn-dependent M28 family amino/carboxypeptidase
MLEMARFFSRVEPDYTLVFAAFWGEEFGLLGSRDFVQSSGPVFIDLKKIKWNINLEMLGRPGKAKPFLVQDPDKGFQDMVPVLNANLFNANTTYSKAFFRNDPFPEEKLFKRSDNFSFHEKKIPSFTIMAGVLPDKYYHAVIDEVATIDFPAMTQIVQAITLALIPLIFKNSPT